MVKWKYNSLKWIHKIREDNHKKTKNDDLRKIVKESVKKVKRTSQN